MFSESPFLTELAAALLASEQHPIVHNSDMAIKVVFVAELHYALMAHKFLEVGMGDHVSL
jgi:hypothetical protein